MPRPRRATGPGAPRPDWPRSLLSRHIGLCVVAPFRGAVGKLPPGEMTKAPMIASRKGYYFEVKAGRRYFWCACGRSANQPFCDGSHAGTEFQPVLFEATADEDVIFCGCKHTGTRPFCDGTHNNLAGGYAEDDPDSAANAAIAFASPGTAAKVPLDGGCYVFSTSRASRSEERR